MVAQLTAFHKIEAAGGNSAKYADFPFAVITFDFDANGLVFAAGTGPAWP